MEKYNYRRIVLANGCFDMFHPGHVELLEKSRELGTYLFVALNSDESVRQLKGPDRPIFNQDQRKKMLLPYVDEVYIFGKERGLRRLIMQIKPMVLVKGPEWEGKEITGQKYVESIGGRVEFVGIDTGISTSGIIERIKNE